MRQEWDEYFMELCHTVASRSTCDRGKPGCVLVNREHQILSTGYAGSPPGLPHCDDVGHLMKTITHDDGTQTNHCMRTIHAEQNAICQAAYRGTSLKGCTAYITMTPCRTCTMLLISCGVVRIVCDKKYHAGKESEEMLKTAGIEIVYMDGSDQSY